MKAFRKIGFAIATFAIVFASIGAPVSAAGTSFGNCSIEPTQLENGGFEQPSFGPNPTFGSRTDDSVPGWKTTASDHRIEFWTNGYLGVPSARGNQFVELNANEVSSLYQDVATTPGEILNWELAHRGRNGVDTMNVVAGPVGGPYTILATLSDDNTAWAYHVGSYTIPAGQTTTRYGFQAVSTSNGNLTQGNFLDDISFGTPACVQVTMSVESLGSNPALPGDNLRYKIVVTNIGGEPARGPLATALIPPNTEYVANSLMSVDHDGEYSQTDAQDGDGAAIVNGKVEFVLGKTNSSGNRTLEPGETATGYFTVKTLPSAANTTVRNATFAQYIDVTTNTLYSDTSPIVSIDVANLPNIPGVPATGRR